MFKSILSTSFLFFVFSNVQLVNAEIVYLNTQGGICHFECSGDITGCPSGFDEAPQACWQTGFGGTSQECGDLAENTCGSSNVEDWNYTSGFYEDVEQIKIPDGRIIYQKKEVRK